MLFRYKVSLYLGFFVTLYSIYPHIRVSAHTIFSLYKYIIWTFFTKSLTFSPPTSYLWTFLSLFLYSWPHFNFVITDIYKEGGGRGRDLKELVKGWITKCHFLYSLKFFSLRIIMLSLFTRSFFSLEEEEERERDSNVDRITHTFSVHQKR